jgi:hypothetical protein
MASCLSLILEQLTQVLALCFNIQNVCPITTLHIAGNQHAMTNIIIWQQTEMAFQTRREFTNLFQFKISSPLSELVDSLPAYLCNSYLHDCHLADDTFHSE